MDNGLKVLMLILDGAGDRPCIELEGKTPLSFANTPNLDRIARLGKTGIIDVIGDGKIPVSCSGALSLLGFNPQKYFTGDTILEALGMDDVSIRNGDLAIHVSFATRTKNSSQLLDRRVCRDLTDEEAKYLADSVTKLVKLSNPNIEFELKNYRYYRNVLILR